MDIFLLLLTDVSFSSCLIVFLYSCQTKHFYSILLWCEGARVRVRGVRSLFYEQSIYQHIQHIYNHNQALFYLTYFCCWSGSRKKMSQMFGKITSLTPKCKNYETNFGNSVCEHIKRFPLQVAYVPVPTLVEYKPERLTSS